MGKYFSPQDKREIFHQELTQLHQGNYLNQDEYQLVKLSYELYHQDILQKMHVKKWQKQMPLPKTEASSITQVPASPAEQKQPTRVPRPLPAPPKPAPTPLNPEQLRERNITWLLVLGVILLLSAGLFLGSAVWPLMNGIFKVLSMSMVAVLFYVISSIAEHVLKIRKTAFAFLTLGSLFIPIILFSAGFMQLFGTWLSIDGDGRFILGLFTSLICIFLYYRIAVKYQSRLFTWLTLISSSSAVAFLLASTQMSVDLFYLGTILYNMALLFMYVKFKPREKFQQFISEMPIFTQLNIILSTVFTIFFFDNMVMYSFNLILTSVVYMSMIYVHKQKEYHFVFTAMLVYGIYQLIEHTPLHSLNAVLFALVGFIYIGLLKFNSDHDYLRKAFQYTSAIISSCAFIYISADKILLSYQDISPLTLLSYLIIAINFMILSHITRHKLFTYLAPIFLFVSAYTLWMLVERYTGFSYADGGLALTTFILFYFLYYNNSYKYLQSIKNSLLHVVYVHYGLIAIVAILLEHSFIASIDLILASLSLWLQLKTQDAARKRHIGTWFIAILWTSSIMLFMQSLNQQWNEPLGDTAGTVYLVCSGLILIGISRVWQTYKYEHHSASAFITGLITYSISMLASLLLYDMYISTLNYLIAISVYAYSAYRLQKKWFWLYTSITCIAFYLSFINLIDYYLSLSSSMLWICLFMLPILLLLVREVAGKKVKELQNYYFWTAQSVNALMIYMFLIYRLAVDIHALVMIIPLCLFVYSVFIPKKEVLIKTFLYVSFSYLFLALVVNLSYYDLTFYPIKNSLIISVVVITALWLITNKMWKMRIDLYLMPFIAITILSLLNSFHLRVFELAYVSLLIGFSFYLLYVRRWHLVYCISLTLTIWLGLRIESMYDLPPLVMTLFFTGLAVAWKLIGERFYQRLTLDKNFDMFTLFSFISIAILFTHYYIGQPMWLQLIPSLLIIYALYDLKYRIEDVLNRRIVVIVAGISCLIPYYTVLNALNINKYIVTELYVLPYILLIMLIKKYVWNHSIVTNIEWLIALVVTAILLGDALQSNTIYDALIIGTLSIVSILGGMQFKLKSYFLIGSGVLLLNLLLQTKSFWSSVPWWAYLLLGGITLIVFASLKEWNRQKRKQGDGANQPSILQRFKSKFNSWS